MGFVKRDLRNCFEVLQEEDKDLAQDPSKAIVEELVACTPKVLLKSAMLKQEFVMSPPSCIGKNGSIGLRAVKDWLRNGRCQESSSITSKIQKLQELRQISMETDVKVPIKFVRSKIL